MADIWNNCLEYFHSVDLTRLLIACAVVVLMFVIKKPLVTLILRLALTALRRKDTAKYEQLKKSLSRILGYVLFLGMLVLALPYISLPEAAFAFINRVLTTILLLLAFMALYRTLMTTVKWFFSAKAKRESDHFNLTARNFLISGIRVAVIVVAAVSILTPWVGSLSGLIAGLGITSLAVALAAQDSLSNFFGSISIMLDKPFDVGDYIVIKDELQGTIEHVGLRSTRIRQLSGSQVTIPNANLANAVVYNETKRSQRRIHFTVGLEYKTPAENLSAFVKAVETLLLEDADVVNDSVKVWFDAFADSSLSVDIIYRVDKPNYYDMLTVKERVNHGVLKAAKDTGVHMAFPSVSVYQAE
ncbi:MAG: mechanosensitive ion channel family protein [Clostridiales bacterium]|nr:mechanosensitive ion channel family protein [Clostridiales bacterium]